MIFNFISFLFIDVGGAKNTEASRIIDLQGKIVIFSSRSKKEPSNLKF